MGGEERGLLLDLVRELAHRGVLVMRETDRVRGGDQVGAPHRSE